MVAIKTSISTLAAALFVLIAASASAQEGIERTELRRTDLTGTDNTIVVVTEIVAQPGAFMPRHIHHGDEFLYILEGGSTQAPGEEPSTVPAGATIHFPRGMPHGGFIVVGDAPLKVLTVHVVDKDKPIAEPVE